MIEEKIKVSKYKPLGGSSYIKFPKELDYSRKSLINIQNSDDNKRLKWFLIRYLNSADHDPARIRKTYSSFAGKLDLKDMKFAVRTRDIQRIEKQCIIINIFAYENK